MIKFSTENQSVEEIRNSELQLPVGPTVRALVQSVSTQAQIHSIPATQQKRFAQGVVMDSLVWHLESRGVQGRNQSEPVWLGSLDLSGSLHQ